VSRAFRRLPPLNALTAFEAVARHCSFSQAAKELFLTHSAVSQRVALLESQLKTKLFLRSTRGVELTPAGARYLESVREALSALAVASDRFSDAEPKVLRVSVVPVLASNWLVYRLRSFHRLHPTIDLDIQASTAMANIKSGEIDVGLRWGKGDWPDLEKKKLFSDELFPVCSDAYLKEAGPIRAPADLKGAVLLRHALQRWKPWFAEAGLDWPEPSSGPLFNDSALMLQAAIHDQGVALGRRILADALIEQGLLVRLFDVSAFVEEGFYVVYSKASFERDEVAAFVSWITSIAHEEVRSADSAC
jgi:LysR family transcriptional regulator, glycine cleavage system transcriptional activator